FGLPWFGVEGAEVEGSVERESSDAVLVKSIPAHPSHQLTRLCVRVLLDALRTCLFVGQRANLAGRLANFLVLCFFRFPKPFLLSLVDFVGEVGHRRGSSDDD